MSATWHCHLLSCSFFKSHHGCCLPQEALQCLRSLPAILRPYLSWGRLVFLLPQAGGQPRGSGSDSGLRLSGLKPTCPSSFSPVSFLTYKMGVSATGTRLETVGGLKVHGVVVRAQAQAGTQGPFLNSHTALVQLRLHRTISYGKWGQPDFALPVPPALTQPPPAGPRCSDLLACTRAPTRQRRLGLTEGSARFLR